MVDHTHKRKMSKVQIRKSKRIAEKLKGKPGVDNPHALARSIVNKKVKKAKVRRRHGQKKES